jgi:hypothetical protein
MAEDTRDKQKSAKDESKSTKQKLQGWIRMHSDEGIKSSPADETVESGARPPDRKTRKEQEKS